MSFDFHTWDYKLNSSFKEIISSVMQYFFLLCPYLISGPWSQKVLGEPGWTIVLLALVLREYYPDAGRLYTFFLFEWERVSMNGAEWEGEGIPSMLSSHHGTPCSAHLTNFRTWPEQKPRVRCSTRWATQEPLSPYVYLNSLSFMLCNVRNVIPLVSFCLIEEWFFSGVLFLCKTKRQFSHESAKRRLSIHLLDIQFLRSFRVIWWG